MAPDPRARPMDVTVDRAGPGAGAAGGRARVPVVVNASGAVVGRGLWFAGDRRLGLRPWADLALDDLGVLPALVRALGPGASLMVAYEGDATEAALRRKVPPPATPLGLALLEAGCRCSRTGTSPRAAGRARSSCRARSPWTRLTGAGRRTPSSTSCAPSSRGRRAAKEDRARARRALGALARRPGAGPGVQCG
jgi:hypothetical protein